MTGAFSRLFNDELHREIEEVQKNPRPAKRYVGDGQFKYQSILDASLPELSEASKLLRRFAFIVDAAGITVERGERYYQYGIEYDVVGEERLIGRDDKGYILYRSDIPTNNYPTGKIDFEPGEPNNFIRETDTRVCIGEGTICLF